MKTDLDRKVFLASKLPEVIEFDEDCFWFEDTPYATPVTEREWDWVVKEAACRLSDMSKQQYENLVYLNGNSPVYQRPCFATWQQRCDALMEMEKTK